MLAVGLVQDVIQTSAQLDVFIHLVGGVGGKHAEAGAFGKVFAHHVAFVDRHAVLAADQTPQAGAAPVAVLIGQPQARLQRRDLRQRAAIAGVFAPGVGQAGVGFPVLAQLITHAHFAAHDVGVDVIGLAEARVVRIVFEQDEIIDAAYISGDPAVEAFAVVLRADVELRGFLALDAGERILAAVRAKLRREQLPVIREALGITDAGIQHQRQVGQRMLQAHKAARQGVRTFPSAGAAEILHQGAVEARAADQFILFAGGPGQFTEGAVAVELGVFFPAAAVHAAVGVGLGVQAAFKLHVLPLPGAHHAAADGAAIELHRHAGGHHVPAVAAHPHAHAAMPPVPSHATAARRAQGDVVHHVVGVVVVDLRFQLIQHVADVGFLHPHAQAFAFELRTVHAAAGIARFAVAAPHSHFQQRVVVRRPAERQIAVPLVPTRWHARIRAVLIVVGTGFVDHHPQVALFGAEAGVDVLVPAAVGAGQHAGVALDTRLVEARAFTLETHRARRRSRPPQHRLRPLGNGQQIEAFRRDVRGRCIHPRWAGAQHFRTVGEDLQPRAEHAAEHRVAVGAAVADLRKAGDGFQVVRTVAGRHRLAWGFRRGDDGQRGVERRGDGDHVAIIILCAGRVLMRLRRVAGQQKQRHGGGNGAGDGVLFISRFKHHLSLS